MKAHALVAAAATSDGATRLTQLRSQAPLVLRRTADGVSMVAGAGGPLGGDDLHLDIDVAPGASLNLSSVAAMVVQPAHASAKDSRAVSCVTVDAIVGADARLRWEPEPTVVTTGARAELRSKLSCAAGASVVWCETLVLGRLDEPGGTIKSTLIADVEDQPALRQTLHIGPEGLAGWDGPAGIAAHRVVATVLLLGPAADHVAPAALDGDVPFAVMSLAAGGLLITVLGATTLDVRRCVKNVLGVAH